MAVEGTGMSLDDDTPIEWSCFSSPYSTQVIIDTYRCNSVTAAHAQKYRLQHTNGNLAKTVLLMRVLYFYRRTALCCTVYTRTCSDTRGSSQLSFDPYRLPDSACLRPRSTNP